MKKVKAAAGAVLEAERPVYRQGGTDRSIAELEAATHRLTQRRLRDMLPGKIETKRLVLRAPIRGDVPDLVKLADNKTIAERLVRLPSPYTRADAIGFIEIFSQRADERPYAITLAGHLIGVIGLSFHEGRPPELGYWLGEPYWGKGYMTEAGRALIDAAHSTHQYDVIGARALADNTASLHVLEKLGFQRLGKAKREEGVHAGKPMVLLELRRPRWM
jgi:RimJ/RimL family protein N-acetyltransferase